MRTAETVGQITGIVQGLMNQQQDGSGVPPPPPGVLTSGVPPPPPGVFTSGVPPPPLPLQSPSSYTFVRNYKQNTDSPPMRAIANSGYDANEMLAFARDVDL